MMKKLVLNHNSELMSGMVRGCIKIFYVGSINSEAISMPKVFICNKFVANQISILKRSRMHLSIQAAKHAMLFLHPQDGSSIT